MRRAAWLLVALALVTAVAGAQTAARPLRGLRAEVAALLVQGIAGGALPIAVAAFPARAADPEAPVDLPLLVEIAALEAAPSGPIGERPLELFVYAIDDAGEVADHTAVELPAVPIGGVGIKIASRLSLGVGRYSLRALVYEPGERRYGLAVQEIDLRARAVSPRLAEECDDWSFAGDMEELAGLSARPVLVAGERLRLSLGEAPPAPAPASGEEWRVRLERVDTTVAKGLEVVATAADPGALDFEVPDLPNGVYRLSVAAPGAAAPGTLKLESWLVSSLPPADGGCRRSWGRVLRLADSGDLTRAREKEPLPAPRGRSSRRLAARYRAVLARLANGGRVETAAGDLAESEAPLIDSDLTKLRLLFSTELEVARELAERDPRCLIPLVALHTRAYAVHFAAGRFPLATHSRRLAATIAELAASLVRTPEDRSLIAIAIIGLADMVETRRASMAAQRLLERALTLDDSQEAARLLLAVSYERKGRYQEARQQLETLVAANSAHHEARVRLAILLRRMGLTKEAERLLLGIVAEQPPDWLLTLSYQTLAQLLVRQGRYPELMAHLEAARRRLPSDQALQLLHAYALDRAGERSEAAELLAGLPMARAGGTARYRYSDAPAAAVGLLRETLRQSITVRLPLLALALHEPASEGPAP